MTRSLDPVLRHVVPLLPPDTLTEATLDFPSPGAWFGFGVALQNPGHDGAVVLLELFDESGDLAGSTTLTVEPSRFIVRLLGDLFGRSPAGRCTVRMSSDRPVQALGVAADYGSGTAWPVAPR